MAIEPHPVGPPTVPIPSPHSTTIESPLSLSSLDTTTVKPSHNLRQVEVKGGQQKAEERFKQLSNEERGKFDEETLVNVNGIRKQSATSESSNESHNQYIVTTIIVTASGTHELPPINNNAQLKEALQKLGSIHSSNIHAVEVLWTPQKENDTLSEQELLKDYSLLRPLEVKPI